MKVRTKRQEAVAPRQAATVASPERRQMFAGGDVEPASPAAPIVTGALVTRSAHRHEPRAPVLRAGALLAVLFLGSGLFGCGEDQKAKLAGTWTVVTDPAAPKPTGVAGIVSDIQSTWVIELKQDGTFKLAMTPLGAAKTIEGTWSIAQSSVTLTPQKVDQSLQAAIPSGRVIVLTVGPGGTRLTLEGRSGKQIVFQRRS